MTDVTDSRVLGAPKYQRTLGDISFARYILEREIEATIGTWAAWDIHKDVGTTASKANIVFSENTRI